MTTKTYEPLNTTEARWMSLINDVRRVFAKPVRGVPQRLVDDLLYALYLLIEEKATLNDFDNACEKAGIKNSYTGVLNLVAAEGKRKARLRAKRRKTRAARAHK